jgi:hypothetical protein
VVNSILYLLPAAIKSRLYSCMHACMVDAIHTRLAPSSNAISLYPVVAAKPILEYNSIASLLEFPIAIVNRSQFIIQSRYLHILEFTF